MPAWMDYKETARSRGALAHELYIVESRPIADPAKMQEILPDHLAYMNGLEQDGHLFLAGPISNEEGTEVAGGMLVYHAQSLDHARELAENDPMHARGGRTFTLRRWLINEGGLSMTVRFNAQSVSIG